MAICDFCQREMTDPVVTSCVGNLAVAYEDDVILSPIPYAGEGPCGDCGVQPGGYHHPGCDNEICPRCQGQLISCPCGWPEGSAEPASGGRGLDTQPITQSFTKGTTMSENFPCIECGRDHSDQRVKYPVGAQVALLWDVGGNPQEFEGDVVGHCMDGRAIIETKINGVSSVHSFHHIDPFVKRFSIAVMLEDLPYWQEQAARLRELAQVADGGDMGELSEADEERSEIEARMAEYFMSLLPGQEA